MVEIVFGADRQGVAEYVKKLISAHGESRGKIEVQNLDDINFSRDLFEQLLFGTSLFGSKATLVIVCRDLLEKNEIEQWIAPQLNIIAEARVLCIFVERSISKEFKEIAKSHGVRIKEFAESKKKNQEFNIFSLTDMFGARKRKEAWLVFQQALRAGVAAETILWKLEWQLKTMAIARVASSAEECELHPYAFTKAKGYANNFKSEELREYFYRLTKIYDDDRSGRRELEYGIELFLLGI